MSSSHGTDPTMAALWEQGNPPPAREVIGVDGEIVVLGPDDKLIVRCPAGMTQDVMEQIAGNLGGILGGSRVALFAHDFEIAVQRGGQ